MMQFAVHLAVCLLMWLVVSLTAVMHLADESGMLLAFATALSVLWVVVNLCVVVFDAGIALKSHFTHDATVINDAIGKELCVRYPSLFAVPWVISVVLQILIGGPYGDGGRNNSATRS